MNFLREQIRRQTISKVWHFISYAVDLTANVYRLKLRSLWLVLPKLRSRTRLEVTTEEIGKDIKAEIESFLSGKRFRRSTSKVVCLSAIDYPF